MLARLTCVKLRKLACGRVDALLHVNLACACGIVDTRNTQETHVMSLHLVNHITHVVKLQVQ